MTGRTTKRLIKGGPPILEGLHKATWSILIQLRNNYHTQLIRHKCTVALDANTKLEKEEEEKEGGEGREGIHVQLERETSCCY